MRFDRPSLWRAPLQAVGMQQQQGKVFLSPLEPQEQVEGDTVNLVGQDGQPHLYEMLGVNAGAGSAASFVFRPGGTAADGVYITWATLMAAIGGLDPATPKFIGIDTSLAAAHVTANATPWNVESCTFEAAGGNGTIILVIDDGATLTYEHLAFVQVLCRFANTTNPVTTLTNGQSVLVTLRQSALSQTGTKSFVSVGSGAVANFNNFDGSAIGAGAVLTTGDGTAQIVAINLGASQFPASVVSGPGSSALFADGSSSPAVSTSQGSGTNTLQVLDPIPVFVFAPGATGVQNANVFTTWAALMAVAGEMGGTREIWLDDTNGALHATTGTWNIDGFIFRARRGTATANLHFDEGCQFIASRVWFDDTSTYTNDATATVPFQCGTGKNCVNLRVHSRGAFLQSSGAIAMFQLSTGGSLTITMNDSATIGDGTHPVTTSDAGTNITINATFSSLAAHAMAGAGTGTYRFDDASTVANPGQDVTTFSSQPKSQAPFVTYSAGTAGNWNPVPSVVSAALDQLAASNHTQATGNTGTGTGTVTVQTGNITKAKNGSMQVSASALISTTAAGTLTVQLKRDATNIGNAQTLVMAAAANGLGVSADFVDTAPDNAAHTYTLSLAMSAGNITCAANSAQIQVVEDS